MTALPRLLDAGSVSQNVTEEIGHQKLAAQYIRRVIQEADEANLIDDEDMHIFGLRPMTDPLDLNNKGEAISMVKTLPFVQADKNPMNYYHKVCCNACKKPVKASNYAAHAVILCEKTKSDDGLRIRSALDVLMCGAIHRRIAQIDRVSSREEISPELDGPAVNRKPPRKERKKSTQTKKATSARELKKFEAVDSDDIVKRNMHLNSTHTMNGSRLNPYDMHCSEDATKGSLKPLKRTAAENPSNPGTKNLCKTAAEVRPSVLSLDVPAPLATKIYYSQRSHHLRSAISHMFFEEPSKEVSNIEVLQVNAVPTQTPDPCNFYNEQVANQQRDDHYSHLAQTPDQILAARSVNYVGKSGGLVPSMNTASQLPVNNTLGPHYTPNSYSFAGKAGNALQPGNGSVPVL
ncbi:hypothetical protein DH2020_035790 [Rehmannia glutinosa]|uniref:Uncharacterized protein n=1 Tax=Rehmannia glutinosa TaxID=99300 RepID=A0ABR0V694_REHGL